jgi:intracellular multiplication protein IcmL
MANEGIIRPSAEKVAATILIGRQYSNFRLQIVSMFSLILAIALVFSVFGAWALAGKDTQYRYVLTDLYGKVVQTVPLDQPNQSDDFIVTWTVDATTRLNTYDFANYRGQFQEAKLNMTPQGWKNFEKGMESAGVLNTVTGLRAVTTAVPTGPGAIIKRGAVKWKDGVTRYAWRVRFPMQISYRSAQKNKAGDPIQLTQAVTADITVIRMPEHLNSNGIGIRQLVLEGR